MKKYFLFIAYVFLALLVRKEFHPFSRFPMYNMFPNWGYVFFLKNERGEMIPFKKYFAQNKDAGNVAHNFYIYFNQHGFMYSDGAEKPEQMRMAGKEMLAMVIKDEPVNQLDFDSLGIYRRYYFLENDELKYRDDLMYEQRIKQ